MAVESALTLVSAPVIAALRTAAPGVGEGALALLSSTESPTEAFVVTLLNDLAALSDDAVLVLDDYHVIEDAQIRDGMIFLVEHFPPKIRLVIASRADPALPLARLRARGELAEIRMGLDLTPGDGSRDRRVRTALKSASYWCVAFGGPRSAYSRGSRITRSHGDEWSLPPNWIVTCG